MRTTTPHLIAGLLLLALAGGAAAITPMPPASAPGQPASAPQGGTPPQPAPAPNTP